MKIRVYFLKYTNFEQKYTGYIRIKIQEVKKWRRIKEKWFR